jgi:hypothetical protein
MDQPTFEYYQRRERAERTAAKYAGSPEARRAHQELAQAYAEMVKQRRVPAAGYHAAGQRPRLSIVVPANA